MKKILIRADDLGYSEGVNYGIAKSVKDGFIRTVGVMTNMSTVNQGLNLLKGTNICYGLHINICVGKPLTNPRLIPSITNTDGCFKTSAEYRRARQDFVNLEEVIIEIEAQYRRFIELTGEKPRYFDGHAISSVNFFKGLEIVAEKYDLKYSGMSTAGEVMIVGNTKVHMWMESMYNDYDPVKTLKKMVLHAHEGDCDVLVCHPGYLDSYLLRRSSLTIPRTLEVEMACNSELEKWLHSQPITLVTYDDL